jgi:putative copper export protein
MILNQGAFYLLAFATVGTLLAASLFISNNEGALSNNGLKIKKSATLLASLWFLSAFLGVIFKVSQILSVPFLEAFDGNTLNSYLTQTDLGKAMFIQLVGLAFVVVALPFFKRSLPLVILMGVALLSLVAPIFQSHAAASGSHALAIGALVTHVIALSLWVGGLFGVLYIPVEERTTALYRFSQLALWAAIAVVTSGIATSWTRLNDKSAWGTQYSYVVIAKVVLTVALLAMGYANRKALESKDQLPQHEFYH